VTNRLLFVPAVVAAVAVTLSAQAELDLALLKKPPTDAWPTFHGDHSGRHYSTLTQINQSTVKNLRLEWQYRANLSPRGAMTGGTVEKPVLQFSGQALRGLLMATPLLVNGVLYFTAPDHAWAVDARTGHEIWHYFWRSRGGEYTGNRGMAMYNKWLYFGTPDGHLVSLDAATGEERWHKEIGSVTSNYYVSAAPVVVKDHLIVGLSGDALDVPAWLESRNPDTGELEWKWNVTPRAGEPAADTWPNDFAREHGGGMTWQPVTYDPQLNLIYVATGNPTPMYNPEQRKGDNLYTCSLVALNPDTGKMVWYFQTSPNEAWDFDANQVPVLIDTTIDGQPRKVVAQATRNGTYYLWDRATGEHLVSAVLAESVNWLLGFDEQGVPIRNPAKMYQRGGALISPSNGGIQNWVPPTYSPDTGLLYFNAMQGFDIHYTFGDPDPATGELGHQAQGVGGYDMSLRAVDIKTGKAKWIHRYAGSEWNPLRPHRVGGLLSTAGGLVFAGNPAGYMVAYEAPTGTILWRAIVPDHGNPVLSTVTNTPITYMLDGRQFLVFAADDTLFAYALPR
jgi:acido-empty-quinoprotein group A